MTRVSIAHDYVTQRGGAERVALALLRAFPGAPLITSVFDQDATFSGFGDHSVRTSPLQRVPAFRRDPRLALPFLAAAWSSMSVNRDEADVVIASSSGWSHGIQTAPDVAKIVYCHNPARWLYQPDEYFTSALKTHAMNVPRARLTRWDAKAAHSASLYLANSSVVADRIRRTYGIEADILPPPVSVDVHGDMDPMPGLEPGFLLTVARGRGYKNTALVEAAVAGMPAERLVVVGGGVATDPADNSRIIRAGIVSDARLRWLYANARAMVSVSFEDFGLTPLEANAFGTPAVLLRAGGFLDTLIEGVTGVYVEELKVDAVRDAIRSLPALNTADILAQAERYSEANFRRRLHSVVAKVTGTSVPVAGVAAPATVLDLRSPAHAAREVAVS